jgi:hypothetical protein
MIENPKDWIDDMSPDKEWGRQDPYDVAFLTPRQTWFCVGVAVILIVWTCWPLLAPAVHRHLTRAEYREEVVRVEVWKGTYHDEVSHAALPGHETELLYRSQVVSVPDCEWTTRTILVRK